MGNGESQVNAPAGLTLRWSNARTVERSAVAAQRNAAVWIGSAVAPLQDRDQAQAQLEAQDSNLRALDGWPDWQRHVDETVTASFAVRSTASGSILMRPADRS